MAKQVVPEIGDFKKVGEGEQAIKKFMTGMDEGSIQTLPESKNKNIKEEKQPKKTGAELASEESFLEESIDKIQKAPELSYEEKLEKHGISQQKAEEVIDALLCEEEYQHTYPITKKYSVTFRTRKFSNQENVLLQLENQNPQYPASVGNIVSKYNLAWSLLNFRGIDFSTYELKAKLKWIEDLPDVTANVLARKLAKFDQMIMDIMDEGSIENF